MYFTKSVVSLDEGLKKIIEKNSASVCTDFRGL